MQDQKATLEQLAQQAREVQTASLVLAAQTALLVIEAQLAWMDMLVRPARRASADSKAFRDSQARTARLVRRGIPDRLARQGLRVV